MRDGSTWLTCFLLDMDEEKLEKLICKALKTQWSELPNGRFNVDIEVSDNDILVWCLSSDVEEGGAE